MKTLHPLTKRIGLLAATYLALALAVFAVDPPPDGGYANENTAEGENALFSLTIGSGNTAVGFNALYSNTSGVENTAIGSEALLSNTTGYVNTANGWAALSANTTGSFNTAIGGAALAANTTGSGNTAIGDHALVRNDLGISNTAIGFHTLYYNTGGWENTALGSDTLHSNTTGNSNTANGFQALYYNTTGSNNVANGSLALLYNRTGIYNVANGSNALVHNTTGNYNVAEGLNALRLNTTGSTNTAVGASALLNNTTGGLNIAVGVAAGSLLSTGSNNIDIGNSGAAGEANTIRIGNIGTQQATFVAGISGKTVAGGVAVVIDSNGHLGTITSSARYKDAIKPMEEASEAILSLQPVTFHYRKELDPQAIPQFGLVAEQVEKVNPDLVARDDQGKPYTVRYEAVNAMLLNEFLKEHRKVEEQATKQQKLELTVAHQQEEIAALTAALKQQAAQMKKVSDELEVRNSAPRLVVNQ